MEAPAPGHDVCLVHGPDDELEVQTLADHLADDARLAVWFGLWTLIPGQPNQPAWVNGLSASRSAVVCIGTAAPTGWHGEMLQLATRRASAEADFRVIPLLLPGARLEWVDPVLQQRTPVDMRGGIDDPWQRHLLVCGIRGIPPGRRTTPVGGGISPGITDQLRLLHRLRSTRLVDDVVALEFQRQLVGTVIGEPRG